MILKVNRERAKTAYSYVTRVLLFFQRSLSSDADYHNIANFDKLTSLYLMSNVIPSMTNKIYINCLVVFELSIFCPHNQSSIKKFDDIGRFNE